MTREEALIQLRIGPGINEDVSEEYNEAVEMAIRVLEEQRCELLILRANLLLRQDAFKEWSERIKKEKEEGLIILPSYFEPILVPNDIEIKIEQEPKTEGARGDIPLQKNVPEMPQPYNDCISRKAVLDGLHSYFAEGFNEDRWWNSTYVLDAINKVPSIQPQPSEHTEERTETHECDYISRKDIGLTNLEILMCNGDYKEALKMLLDKIEKAPSVTPQPKAEPQQKTGHWIEHKHGGIEHIECSECGVWFLKNNLIRKSYCPNCGSCNGDMIKNIMRDIAKNKGGAECINSEFAREFNTQLNIEHIIKTTIKEYIDKDCDDVTELLLSLNKDLCERIRKGE